MNSKPIPVIPSAFTPSSPNPEIAATLRHQYPDRFIIGHIGALVDRHKGQRVLIEAAKLVEKEHPNLLFLFFGQGEDETALQKESYHLKMLNGWDLNLIYLTT